MADVVIFVGIAGAVAAVVWKKINDIREGKSGCGCGSFGCAGCRGCTGREEEKE
ncbi:FeoB-associated Cys-rich membrane protein [Clostridiaceae bacterium]|nr:FeoB-associated Cys-rich membrane protein [Clostridiaceae bacterium]RKI09317.1 FeoB-associated Cys-rich membrane protein [bacterium 1XD21-70]